MSEVVFLGVVLAMMFLVAFSEWFGHLVVGINELIPSGYQFYSQVIGWVIISLVSVMLVFWVLAMVYECPRGERREGVFALMDCGFYWRLREVGGF